MATPYLFDTNVLIAANRPPGTSIACALEAIQRLRQVKEHGILVLDDEFRVLNEYKNHCNSAGRPGVGDEFYLWALLQYDQALCHRLPLTAHDERGYAEFPDDAALAGFDPSDRKFVALNMTHPDRPAIVVAADSDWIHDEAALRTHGVRVDFLCVGEPGYSQR